MGEALACEQRLSRSQRITSLAECALGVIFVLAHNVWRVLPNEVYLLVGVALVSLWIRNGGYATAGMRRPRSWTWTLLAAVATGALLQLKDYVTEPLGRFFSQQPQHVSKVMPHAHDLHQMLTALLIVWTFAAFGEEFGYRAYLMTRFGEMAGGGLPGKLTSLVAVSLLFGFAHFYKGPAGIFDSAVSGLLLGTVYLATGNLWAPILAHGVSDTIAVAAYYLGWTGAL